MSKTIGQSWTSRMVVIALFLFFNTLATPALGATCKTNCLSVFSNTLTDRGTYLHGIVKLWDETHAGAGARGSVVHGRWTRPDGSTLDQYARIGTRLRAEFKLYGATASGTYSLTVVDVAKSGYTFDPENGRLLVSEITIGGSVNQSPIAVANADIIGGSAPLAVTFDSTGSTDPDGTIVAYAWDFGDGGSASDANPTYQYNNVGNYNAALTVTDDMGAMNTNSIAIEVVGDVVGCLTNCMAVDRLSMSYKASNNSVNGLVWLVDEHGARVREALVHGVWTLPDGTTTIDQYANSGTRARAAFKLDTNAPGMYRLTVVEVTKLDNTFDLENSNVLFGLIEVAP